MQDTETKNLIEIGKLIASIFIPIIVAYMTYAKLSNKLELNKFELNKNLYEFQTRFALMSERKTDAFEKLYSTLIELSRFFFNIFLSSEIKDREQLYQSAFAKFIELQDIYEKNQIYFDDDLCKDFEEIQRITERILGKYNRSNYNYRKDRENEPEKLIDITLKNESFKNDLMAYNEFNRKFIVLKENLRNKFRQLPSNENLKLNKGNSLLSRIFSKTKK